MNIVQWQKKATQIEIHNLLNVKDKTGIQIYYYEFVSNRCSIVVYFSSYSELQRHPKYVFWQQFSSFKYPSCFMNITTSTKLIYNQVHTHTTSAAQFIRQDNPPFATYTSTHTHTHLRVQWRRSQLILPDILMMLQVRRCKLH